MSIQRTGGNRCVHCDAGERPWAEVPLNIQEAAAALGVSVRSLFALRRRYAKTHEIEARRSRRVVFYREHIETMKDLLKWENMTVARPRLAGSRSGKATPGAMTSMSKGLGTGALRGSAIRKRLG